MCPHNTVCVLILLYLCSHTTIYVSSFSYMFSLIQVSLDDLFLHFLYHDTLQLQVLNLLPLLVQQYKF